MNTRIKELRKTLGLTQEAFGNKIGLKRNSVSQIESGTNNLSAQNILSICREFHVNEAWLKNGQLPMFAASSRKEQIKDWVDKILTEEPEGYKVRLASGLAGLDEAGWKAVYSLALAMVRGIEDSEEQSFGDSEQPPAPDDDARIELEAEMVKESYIQSQKMKKSVESSGGSISTA